MAPQVAETLVCVCPRKSAVQNIFLQIKRGLELMKKRLVKLTVILSIGVLLLFAVGCRNEKNTSGAGDKADPNVLAVVGDDEITRDQLELALARIPESKRQALKRRALDDLIRAKVFSARAREVGLDSDPRVEKALDEATDDILARAFVSKHIDKQAEPADEEVKKYYQDHKDEFFAPEGVKIQHIRVKEKEQAEKVLKALKKGAPFEELAKKYSTARSGKKGGVLGLQYRGWLDPALEKAAFALEKGKISDIVITEKGDYEIVKTLDKKEKTQIPFEEAEAAIHSRLSSAKKKELFDQYYEKAGVDLDPSEEGVLARVGDEAITEEAFATELAKVSEKEKGKAKKQWISYLIDSKVFSNEARKVKLDNDPEVAAGIARITGRILAQTYYEEFVKGRIQVSPQEVRDYYESHQEEFRTPVRLRVKSIQVETKEEAQKILAELEKGASFRGLAEKYSPHPSDSKMAGMTDWFVEGEKDPALEQVAFFLNKGERSGIIETEAGYEIIEVVGKKGGEVTPLSKAKEDIKKLLSRQKFRDEKQDYYKKARVKVYGP